MPVSPLPPWPQPRPLSFDFCKWPRSSTGRNDDRSSELLSAEIKDPCLGCQLFLRAPGPSSSSVLFLNVIDFQPRGHQRGRSLGFERLARSFHPLFYVSNPYENLRFCFLLPILPSSRRVLVSPARLRRPTPGTRFAYRLNLSRVSFSLLPVSPGRLVAERR